MNDAAQKILVGVLSAMLSGGITVVTLASGTAGRLEAVEKALVRIEGRLDNLNGARK